MEPEDYRYSQEARDHGLKIVWKCAGCQNEREEYPGCNEHALCPSCGGRFSEAGETYLS